jgi:hypothetical protein
MIRGLSVALLGACAPGETREVVQLPVPRPPVAAAPATVVPPAVSVTAADNTSDSEGWTVNVGALDSVSPQIPIPRVVKNFCPGEMCGYPHELVACRSLVLHSTDSVGAPEVGRASARDTITVETGNFYITGPEKIYLSRDYAITQRFDADGFPVGPRRDTSARFAAGDTLYLLESQYPGIVTWWYRGMLGQGFAFWDQKGPSGDIHVSGSGAAAVSRGKSVWWYKVRTPDGVEGWWKQQGIETVGTGSMARRCDFEKGEADMNPEHYRD